MKLITGRKLMGRTLIWKPVAGLYWSMFMGLYFLGMQVVCAEVLHYRTQIPVLFAAVFWILGGVFLLQHYKSVGVFKVRIDDGDEQ
jgi:hypothetical protein